MLVTMAIGTTVSIAIDEHVSDAARMAHSMCAMRRACGTPGCITIVIIVAHPIAIVITHRVPHEACATLRCVVIITIAALVANPVRVACAPCVAHVDASSSPSSHAHNEWQDATYGT